MSNNKGDAMLFSTCIRIQNEWRMNRICINANGTHTCVHTHAHMYIHNMLASVLSSHEIFHFPQLHRDRSCTYVYVTAGDKRSRQKSSSCVVLI